MKGSILIFSVLFILNTMMVTSVAAGKFHVLVFQDFLTFFFHFCTIGLIEFDLNWRKEKNGM